MSTSKTRNNNRVFNVIRITQEKCSNGYGDFTRDEIPENDNEINKEIRRGTHLQVSKLF